MGYNFDKRRSAHDHGSFWTSYSDLFLGMSVIFLLLYVTASLRTGTEGFRSAIENKKLALQVEDLQNQLKAYDSVRKDYLSKQAKPGEEQVYNELIDKLSLLQEDSELEKDSLKKALLENDQKSKALNQYQQMVRNIINANIAAKSKLQRRDTVIEEQDAEIDQQDQRIVALQSDINMKSKMIEKAEAQLENSLAQLEDSFRAQKITKAAYQKRVSKLQAESDARVAELREQIGEAKGEIAQKSADLKAAQRKLVAESNQSKALAGELEKERETSSGLGSQVSKLGGQLKETENQLAKARAEANARRQIAQDIKKGFAKAGVKAEVDDRTGEVVLSFGDVYFDNDSAQLKARMKETLQKAMPSYANSLLGNPKVAQKISSIEIIGYASPTYQGKYVDPEKLDAKSKQAVNYNLDLSYQRARSLFQYVFDEKNMQFKFQDQMYPLIKVTGRSFLAERTTRNPAAKGGEFCQTHDCRKGQRVIIQFNFDNKK